MFLEDYNRAQDLYMSSTCPVAALEVSESFEKEQCVCVCVYANSIIFWFNFFLIKAFITQIIWAPVYF